ncbi:Hsp20/alpha crystallin family protein [Cysteiniphilum litorale]|uniref:Hsp20/alpha crystallin family protein n=1 Tax=Cysteiniphilum litorale TaxID=2056700 RepID=UPI003F880BF0
MSRNSIIQRNRTPFALRSSINDLFDDFFSLPSMFSQHDKYMQSISLDLTEDDNAYHVAADIAGVDEKDINIELDKNLLTVKAKREHKHKDKKHHVQECYYGEYQRTIALPDNIEADKVEAKYQNGVLNINIPKSAKTATVKKIAVKK